MVKDIDRKLRLTIAVLGTVGRKDLAAAFRKVNPSTSFDVERADKWLHGRARPRDMQIYEDWSKVLDLENGGRWVAECDFEVFAAHVGARHGRDAEELQRQMSSRATGEGQGLLLAGTYVCYSHAWSPYFRGRLVRGALSVTASHRPDRPSASYSEILPTGRMQLDGAIGIDKRGLRAEICDTRNWQYVNFSLFPPSPPVSMLGGMMFGTTLIGPDAQPSMSRVVAIRLPAASARLQSEEAYLPEGASIALDLATLGLPIDEPAVVDRCLAMFLNGGARGGIDQVSVSDYRALVELFDGIWLMLGRDSGTGPHGAHEGGSTVRPFPGHFARTPR